ncbi:shikimate dehydrogenase [bacterium]|nr:shikimate dehydrogenase [bacterium]
MDVSEEMSCFEWRDAPEGDFAVLGDPVSHSLSPKMHGAAYAELGLELRYLAIRVELSEFDQALDHLVALGYQGVNVTVPLKEVAFEWCESLEDGAWRYGAVNTIRLGDRAGMNTDVPGFLSVLRAHSVEPGSRVLVLGAGGSARALIRGLLDEGYAVRGWNRTRAKLDAVVEGLDIEVLDGIDVRDCEAVVNATSASLGGFDLPVEWSQASDGCLAFDLAYGKELSPFLRGASGRGLPVTDGLPMLVEQGALAFEWWLGRPAPRTAMLRSVGL